MKTAELPPRPSRSTGGARLSISQTKPTRRIIKPGGSAGSSVSASSASYSSRESFVGRDSQSVSLCDYRNRRISSKRTVSSTSSPDDLSGSSFDYGRRIVDGHPGDLERLVEEKVRKEVATMHKNEISAAISRLHSPGDIGQGGRRQGSVQPPHQSDSSLFSFMTRPSRWEQQYPSSSDASAFSFLSSGGASFMTGGSNGSIRGLLSERGSRSFHGMLLLMLVVALAASVSSNRRVMGRAAHTMWDTGRPNLRGGYNPATWAGSDHSSETYDRYQRNGLYGRPTERSVQRNKSPVAEGGNDAVSSQHDAATQKKSRLSKSLKLSLISEDRKQMRASIIPIDQGPGRGGIRLGGQWLKKGWSAFSGSRGKDVEADQLNSSQVKKNSARKRTSVGKSQSKVLINGVKDKLALLKKEQDSLKFTTDEIEREVERLKVMAEILQSKKDEEDLPKLGSKSGDTTNPEGKEGTDNLATNVTREENIGTEGKGINPETVVEGTEKATKNRR